MKNTSSVQEQCRASSGYRKLTVAREHVCYFVLQNAYYGYYGYSG